MEIVTVVLFSTLCCVSVVFVPRLIEWLRAWLILQKMPGPKGGIMGHLKYFNDSYVGQHKAVMKWAREFGSIYRVRLANINVSFLGPPLALHRNNGRKRLCQLTDDFTPLCRQRIKENTLTS